MNRFRQTEIKQDKIENYPALFHSVQKYVIIYTDYK